MINDLHKVGTVKIRTSIRCSGMHACISTIHPRQNISPPKQSSHLNSGPSALHRVQTESTSSARPSRRSNSRKYISRSGIHFQSGSSCRNYYIVNVHMRTEEEEKNSRTSAVLFRRGGPGSLRSRWCWYAGSKKG